MTTDEKRIKIAEHLGATLWANPTNKGSESLWCFYCPGPCEVFSMDDPTESSLLPDYFADLNAMRGAESSLTKEQRALYAESLTHSIRDQENPGFYHERFLLVHLSAADRAEVFGLTLNLWQAGEQPIFPRAGHLRTPSTTISAERSGPTAQQPRGISSPKHPIQ